MALEDLGMEEDVQTLVVSVQGGHSDFIILLLLRLSGSAALACRSP